MADRSAPLSTTSYAVLSLLSLQPWTTYELAQQMKRSLHWFWPRAESKLYEEPKKLVSRKLARSKRRYVGKRASTVYTITPAGRRALAAWVRAPGDPGPTLEFEALLRVLSAQCVGVQDLRRTLESVRKHMDGMVEFGERQGAEIATTGGPFPDRIHIVALVHGFMDIYVDAVRRWAVWALAEVTDWQDTASDEEKLARARQLLSTPVADVGANAGRTHAGR
ncbi:MAG: PadR family transcriptional regulator [Acidimicrobiales bacterium]